MKPIGTITMCFPHVDEETRSVLQSNMDEAENFGDFTERLCNRVCLEPSPPLLMYLAAQYAFWIEHFALLDRLDTAGKISDLAMPLLLFVRKLRGQAVTWKYMNKSMKRALNAAPNDWIACHLYLSWRLLADYVYPESDVDLRPLNAVMSGIEENPDFACFKPYILWIKGHQYEKDCMTEEAIELWKQAAAVAQEFDDQPMLADLIRFIADRTRLFDVEKAIDLFNSTRELSARLGYICGVGKVQQCMGSIMLSRGEIDAAIELSSDFRRICDSIGRETESSDTFMAFIYNQIGKGEEAYTLAKRVVDLAPHHVGGRPQSGPHTQLAWALINLGIYDVAKEELATARAAAMKLGSTTAMLMVDVVEAILDAAEGNFDSAILSFKELLDVVKANPHPTLQNICLLNLAEIEIRRLTNSSLKRNMDSSGPWMTALMEHAARNGLTGIGARALLLKAQLRRKQGRFDEMDELLTGVQKAAEAPSMKYLKELAVSVFPDIIMK